MKLTKRNATIGLAALLGVGAFSTAAVLLWPDSGPKSPPEPTFLPDRRLPAAREAVARAKAELMKPGDCCCLEGCTLCILERGVCTCAEDAVRRKAVCAECGPRLSKAIEQSEYQTALADLEAKHADDPVALRRAKLALLNASPLDQRIERLKQEDILPDDLILLSRRALRDPEIPHAIRDPRNPCWLRKQNTSIQEALGLLEAIKRDLNAEEPRLNDCCCNVSCNDCVLKYGSCGCADAIANAMPEPGPLGVGQVKFAKPCGECVRMWTLHPENGTVLFTPLGKDAVPRPPLIEDLKPAGDAVPHPKTRKPQ